MDVSTIMSSSAQMQQALTEITQFDEAGNPQSNTQQSVRFSQLLEQCAGTGEGMRKSTDPFAAGVIPKAIAATLQTSRQLPEQQAPDGGLIPVELGAGFLQSSTAAGKSLPEMKVQSEPENDSEVYSPEEGQNEPDAVSAGTDFPWAPLFAPAYNFMALNDAKPLAEPRAMEPSPVGATAKPAIANGTEAMTEAPPLLAEISGQEGKTDSLKPGNPVTADQGGAIPVPAGMVTFQENTATEGQLAELNPDLLVKEATEGTSARNLTKAATSLNPEVSVSDLESGAMNRPSFVSDTSLNRDISLTAESKPEGDAGKQGKSLKQGTNMTLPQPEAVSNAGGEVPLPRTQGQNADTLEIPGRKTVATVPDQAGAIDTPLPGENRRGGETAINAYRAVNAEGAAQGKKGAPLFPADIRPSTTQAMQEPDAVDSGETPHLIDIVFAEKGKALTRGAGGEVAGKAEAVGSATIETPVAFVQGQGELRTNGELRMLSPANEAKAPTPGQIHQQVREKLESGDYGLNKGNITLKLHPDELGELKINLRMDEHRLKIEIVTENPSVKEALMQNLDTLKETLSRQNIAMDRFNVSTDIRQGFQQGARDERELTQGKRGTSAALQPATAVEEATLPKFLYGWENDNSLVSLVL